MDHKHLHSPHSLSLARCVCFFCSVFFCCCFSKLICIYLLFSLFILIFYHTLVEFIFSCKYIILQFGQSYTDSCI